MNNTNASAAQQNATNISNNKVATSNTQTKLVSNKKSFFLKNPTLPSFALLSFFHKITEEHKKTKNVVFLRIPHSISTAITEKEVVKTAISLLDNTKNKNKRKELVCDNKEYALCVLPYDLLGLKGDELLAQLFPEKNTVEESINELQKEASQNTLFIFHPNEQKFECIKKFSSIAHNTICRINSHSVSIVEDAWYTMASDFYNVATLKELMSVDSISIFIICFFLFTLIPAAPLYLNPIIKLLAFISSKNWCMLLLSSFVYLLLSCFPTMLETVLNRIAQKLETLVKTSTVTTTTIPQILQEKKENEQQITKDIIPSPSKAMEHNTTKGSNITENAKSLTGIRENNTLSATEKTEIPQIVNPNTNNSLS